MIVIILRGMFVIGMWYVCKGVFGVVKFFELVVNILRIGKGCMKIWIFSFFLKFEYVV